jgi:hypothetical protein
MRDTEDDQYGSFTVEHGNLRDGDNRASFIHVNLGHRVHHLYLWHLADKMGALKNVLSTLSAEVGADGDNVHTDTSQVQNKRKRTEEEEEEKRELRSYRASLSDSIRTLAASNKADAITNMLSAITHKQEMLVMLEDKMEKYELQKMEYEDAGDVGRIEYYGKQLGVLQKRHGEYSKDIRDLKAELNKLKAEE